MTEKSFFSPHGIKDNHSRGNVADFLGSKLANGSRFSVVSAYFTIYAYDALRKELDGIESLQFLFGEPRFVQSLDPEKTDKKAFKMEDEGLSLSNRLQQKEVARRCAEWIGSKVEIRSIRQANLLHGKLYHIDDGRREHALMGSSNFTRRGLGLSATPNIELNMVVDSDRDRADLKAWFDELWQDTALVEDVKAKVLGHLLRWCGLDGRCQGRHPTQGKLHFEGGKQASEGGKPSLPPLPPGLAAKLPAPGQRIGEAALRQLIRDLCGWQALRGEELATLLGKDLKYLHNKHLSAMVQAGELVFQFPESPNHRITDYRPTSFQKNHEMVMPE